MSEDDSVSRTDTPPLRFAMVEDHPPLYRGSYPLLKNLRFLERLHLKTIVSMTPEPLGEQVATWCSAQGIRMMHLKTKKQTKTEQHPIGYYETKQAIQMMINRVHQPIYIHCLNGSVVTSLVIACLRKLQCWSVSSIMAEFRRFCLVKPVHTSFIETFHLEIEITKACPRWLFRGIEPMGKDGIIAVHPTLKLKYLDPEMARLSLELREELEAEHQRETFARQHEHERPHGEPSQPTHHFTMSNEAAKNL